MSEPTTGVAGGVEFDNCAAQLEKLGAGRPAPDFSITAVCAAEELSKLDPNTAFFVRVPPTAMYSDVKQIEALMRRMGLAFVFVHGGDMVIEPRR